MVSSAAYFPEQLRVLFSELLLTGEHLVKSSHIRPLICTHLVDSLHNHSVIRAKLLNQLLLGRDKVFEVVNEGRLVAVLLLRLSKNKIHLLSCEEGLSLFL